MSYEFLEHTADVKFRASGETIEEMFSSAAMALNEVIRGDITILEQEEKELEVKGKDMVSLLHNFLEEFLYLLDAEDFLVSSIKEIGVDKSSFKVIVKVVGDNAEKYKFTSDVKAVTYSEMKIVEDKEGFNCTVVLDV